MKEYRFKSGKTCIRLDSRTGDTVRKSDSGYSRASVERTVSDRCDIGGNENSRACLRRIDLKKVVTGDEKTVVGEVLSGSNKLGAAKCSACNSLNACGKLDSLNVRKSCECVSTDLSNTLADNDLGYRLLNACEIELGLSADITEGSVPGSVCKSSIILDRTLTTDGKNAGFLVKFPGNSCEYTACDLDIPPVADRRNDLLAGKVAYVSVDVVKACLTYVALVVAVLIGMLERRIVLTYATCANVALARGVLKALLTYVTLVVLVYVLARAGLAYIASAVAVSVDVLGALTAGVALLILVITVRACHAALAGVALAIAVSIFALDAACADVALAVLVCILVNDAVGADEALAVHCDLVDACDARAALIALAVDFFLIDVSVAKSANGAYAIFIILVLKADLTYVALLINVRYAAAADIALAMNVLSVAPLAGVALTVFIGVDVLDAADTYVAFAVLVDVLARALVANVANAVRFSIGVSHADAACIALGILIVTVNVVYNALAANVAKCVGVLFGILVNKAYVTNVALAGKRDLINVRNNADLADVTSAVTVLVNVLEAKVTYVTKLILVVSHSVLVACIHAVAAGVTYVVLRHFLTVNYKVVHVFLILKTLTVHSLKFITIIIF